jgi:hypothetical protein
MTTPTDNAWLDSLNFDFVYSAYERKSDVLSKTVCTLYLPKELKQAILTHIDTVCREARQDERANCWRDFHKAYEVGDKSGDYIIKGVAKKVHANNRKFRVECYWCGAVMFRYSNKFKVKHIICSCWRDEEKRQERIAELNPNKDTLNGVTK